MPNMKKNSTMKSPTTVIDWDPRFVTKKGPHGGRRLGAGRPSKFSDTLKRMYVLRRDQVELIEAQSKQANMSLSAWLRHLIDTATAHLKTSPDETSGS